MAKVDPWSATAADFDAAAQRNANAFWFWLIVTGVAWWFASVWWSLPLAALAIWSGYSSIHCTMLATALRKGTYRIVNPNNGAPDGDARNYLDGEG